MTWLYNSKEVTIDDLDGYTSFVYLITNEKTKKKYYGKKRLQFYRRKKVPGRFYRKKIVKDSDWRDYWGSSSELIEDIQKHGKESFTREILMLCNTISEANYYELKYQMDSDVLLHPNEYYNSYIGTRVNRIQLGIK